MHAPPLLSRSSNKAAALIIVLAFVVLVTGLALAYFTRTTTERQLAQSSYNDTSADLLARSALDVVVGDFKQEIVNGSTARTVSGTNGAMITIYVPMDATKMIPVYNPTPSPSPAIAILNLIRRSVRSDTIPSPAVASRASAVNSMADASANGRSISLARWNRHYLVPKSNVTDGGSDPITNGFSAPNYWAPDWVFVTGQGPSVIMTPDNSVIGRYAYAVYDEGGLLNMNIVGFPVPGSPWPGLTQEIARNKTVPGAFDLTALGTPVQNVNPFNQIIGFRNYATAGEITGTLGSFSFDQRSDGFSQSISNYIAYVLGSPVGSPKLGFGPSGRDFAAVNPLATPLPGGGFRTDQSFMTRAELINLFKSLNFDCTSNTGICITALQYLGTFSLEQNEPTLPLTPAWAAAGFTPVVLPQRFSLGNLNEVVSSGNAANIQRDFGLQLVTPTPTVAPSPAGPCDNQLRWKYVGQDPNPAATPRPDISSFPSDLTQLDFFQYINYALFGDGVTSNANPANMPFTLGIGAALIDQYDTDALNTGIYYGSSPASCDPAINACLVYGPEQTGLTTVSYQPPTCITPLPPTPTATPPSFNSINHPTRSVGEFGWAYSILNAYYSRNAPQYLIDFKDPYNSTSNPDPALLDFFTYNSAPVRAGIVSLNTRQPVVLSAILKTAWCASPLNASQALTAANSIVTATNPSTGGVPAMSRADIPGLRRPLLGSLCDAPDSQDKQDTFARALSEVTQTRTWGLLIDVVAQTGHYKPNATNLQTDFVVEGEKRYWLHIAIDRFDGSIVGQQLEEVTE